jgi:hypothetical protein
VRELEPAVQALAANKDDPKARDNAAAAAKGNTYSVFSSVIDFFVLCVAIRQPISSIIEDLQFAPEAQREEAQQMVNQILAALKQKSMLLGILGVL